MEMNENNAANEASSVNVTVNPGSDGQGYPESTSIEVEKAPESPVQPSNDQTPPVEPVSHPDDLKAATERLKQQTARNNKLLSSLGLDPTSDLAEQLEMGVITPDMVYQHINRKFGNQNQPPVTPDRQPVSMNPVAQAQGRLADARAAYDAEASEGGVSLKTNSDLLQAIQDLNDAKLEDVTRQFTASKQEQQASDTVGRVLNIARKAPEYVNMQPNLQEVVDRTSVALTGMIADREARTLGLDPAALNSQQVEYFANKAQVELEQLANYFIGVGERRVKQGFRPNNNQTIPVPAGNSGSPVAPINPYGGANVSNHRDLARNFVQNARRV